MRQREKDNRVEWKWLKRIRKKRTLGDEKEWNRGRGAVLSSIVELRQKITDFVVLSRTESLPRDKGFRFGFCGLLNLAAWL